eukprot:m.65612 g.65612  ORF g.65612 m.65612 type:complete len:641 (-) comp11747_c0_seq2:99-2021(-)
MKVFAALSLLVVCVHGDASELGPGPNAWVLEDPSVVSLSKEKLEASVESLVARGAFRYCTLIAKNGRLIFEKYHYNNSLSLYESDSMGKTAIAAVVGIAVTKGLVDLDTPVYKYGVPDVGIWNETGVSYYKQVTTRHILSMTTGYGRVPPGTFFTYSSDDWVQTLSLILRAVTKEDPVIWATRELAEPLGINDLFLFDDLQGDISAGGGQMYTCSMALRVSQLITNNGWWRFENGTAVRLISQEYMDQLFNPSFPNVNAGYGFLTWLNTAVGDTHCCAPRWGLRGRYCSGANNTNCTTCCQERGQEKVDPKYGYCNPKSTQLDEDQTSRPITPGEPQDQWMLRNGASYIEDSMVGDNIKGSIPAPSDLAVAMGQWARYMVMVPSLNLSIVSIGTTDGWSTKCWGGYDDAFMVAMVWESLAEAVTTKEEQETLKSLLGKKKSDKKFLTTVEQTENSTSTTSVIMAHSSPNVHKKRKNRKLGTLAHYDSNDLASFASKTYAGSCSCNCNPWQGNGRCFNVPIDLAPKVYSDPSETCDNILKDNEAKRKLLPWNAKNSDYCIELGITKQCNYPADKHTNLCTEDAFVFMPYPCRQVSPCAPLKENTAFATTICACQTKNFGGCTWSNSTCDYTPYYRPATWSL